MRQLVAPLAARGVAVREMVPALERHARFPFLPEGMPLAALPPLWAGWQLAKLAARVPGILESRRADVTWLERGLLPAWPSLERALARPLVLDVDDAIWMQRPFGAKALAWAARRADVVVAGNAFLAEWLSAHARRVEILPTSVDVRRVAPRAAPCRGDGGRLVLGWMGSRWTLPHLATIEGPLAAFLRTHDAELLVVADAPPVLPSLDPARVRFEAWSDADEARLLTGMDVGLAPLPDDLWSRGKCGAKLLLYLAAGIPVIASPVGGQAEILSRADVGIAPRGGDGWLAALDAIASDEGLRRRLGDRGRLLAETEYSANLAAERLAALFRGLVQRR